MESKSAPKFAEDLKVKCGNYLILLNLTVHFLGCSMRESMLDTATMFTT